MKVEIIKEKDTGRLLKLTDKDGTSLFYDLTPFEHLLAKMLIELTNDIRALAKKIK